ncbi:methylmalonyl-CoA epimerase, mitochondrial isoform X2 [Eretmochelys imbricata]
MRWVHLKSRSSKYPVDIDVDCIRRRKKKEIARKNLSTHGLLTRLQTTAHTVRTLSVSRSLTQKVPCSLWKLGRLNHVAIAVPDLEKAQSFYKSVLGAQVSETVPLPEHGVYTVFVELGNTKLELLHPLGEKSPISGFLQKNKAGGMHHICIEVDDIKAAMAELKEKKIRILSEEPKIGAHGKPVIFLHPKDCDGVLVELEQA